MTIHLMCRYENLVNKNKFPNSLDINVTNVISESIFLTHECESTDPSVMDDISSHLTGYTWGLFGVACWEITHSPCVWLWGWVLGRVLDFKG